MAGQERLTNSEWELYNTNRTLSGQSRLIRALREQMTSKVERNYKSYYKLKLSQLLAINKYIDQFGIQGLKEVEETENDSNFKIDYKQKLLYDYLISIYPHINTHLDDAKLLSDIAQVYSDLPDQFQREMETAVSLLTALKREYGAEKPGQLVDYVAYVKSLSNFKLLLQGNNLKKIQEHIETVKEKFSSHRLMMKLVMRSVAGSNKNISTVCALLIKSCPSYKQYILRYLASTQLLKADALIEAIASTGEFKTELKATLLKSVSNNNTELVHRLLPTVVDRYNCLTVENLLKAILKTNQNYGIRAVIRCANIEYSDSFLRSTINTIFSDSSSSNAKKVELFADLFIKQSKHLTKEALQQLVYKVNWISGYLSKSNLRQLLLNKLFKSFNRKIYLAFLDKLTEEERSKYLSKASDVYEYQALLLNLITRYPNSKIYNSRIVDINIYNRYIAVAALESGNEIDTNRQITNFRLLFNEEQSEDFLLTHPRYFNWLPVKLLQGKNFLRLLKKASNQFDNEGFVAYLYEYAHALQLKDSELGMYERRLMSAILINLICAKSIHHGHDVQLRAFSLLTNEVLRNKRFYGTFYEESANLTILIALYNEYHLETAPCVSTLHPGLNNFVFDSRGYQFIGEATNKLPKLSADLKNTLELNVFLQFNIEYMELAELLRFQRSTRRYSNLKERATLFFRTPEHDKISNSVSNDKKTVELISSLENDVTTLQRAIDNIEHYNLDLVKSMRFLSISYAVHQIYDILVTLSQAKICGAQIENFTVPLESHQATILEIADKITNLSDEFKGSSSSEDTTPHLGCCMKRLHLAVSNANVLKCYEIYASMERVDGLKVMIYGGGLQDIFQLRINIARQCNQTDFIDSTNFRLMFLNYSRTVYKELMEIRNNSVVKRLITARAEQMKQGLNLLLSNIRETQTNTVTLNGAGSFLDVRQRILTVSYIEDIIACLNAHSTLLETPELKRLERSQFPNILDAIGQIRVSASLGYISARHHRDAINTLFGEYLTEEEAAYLEIKSKGIYDSYLAIPVNQEQDSPLILIQKAIENSMNSRAQITSTGASSSNLQNQSARNTSKSKKKASKKSNR